MSQDLLERARAVVLATRKRGVQEVRVNIRRTREGEAEWRDGKIDRLRESTQLGLAVTLYVNGRYSANSTSDLRPDAIERFLEETIAATRVLAKDAHRKLADPQRYGNRYAGELGIWDQAGSPGWSGAERCRQAQLLEEAARSAPGAAEIVSVTTSASDNTNEAAMVCSNGMEAMSRGTSFGLYAETAVRDQGARKPEGSWYALTRQRGKLPSIASVGMEATRRALLDRQAQPMKSGRYACLIENAVTARVLRDFLAPLAGRAIQQKRSLFGDKLGQKIASELLSVNDDPWLPEGNASAAYDGEGMSTQRRPLVQRGVLQTFFLDTYYASKLGREPTTAEPSNLVFTNGKHDLGGMLGLMHRGILITGFIGGNANSATGDFSMGIRGQWVHGGHPVRAIAEMNLAGNLLDFWKRLAAVGSDPYPYSWARCPSLLFDALQFSGT